MASFTMQIGVDETPSNMPIYNLTEEESIMEHTYGSNDYICQLHIGIFDESSQPVGYVSCAYGCYPFVFDGMSFAESVEAYTDKYPWIREEFYHEATATNPDECIVIDGGFVHVYAVHKMSSSVSTITRGQLLSGVVKNLKQIVGIVGEPHPWSALLDEKKSFAAMIVFDPAFAPHDQYTPMGEIASDLSEDLATDPAKTKIEFVRIT